MYLLMLVVRTCDGPIVGAGGSHVISLWRLAESSAFVYNGNKQVVPNKWNSVAEITHSNHPSDGGLVEQILGR